MTIWSPIPFPSRAARAQPPDPAVNPSRRRSRTAGFVAVLLAPLVLASAPDLPAQIIPVKTVPLATGDQFLVHPTGRLGMGGVSLALDDPEGDPFTNPAQATRVESSRVVATPTYYSVSDGNGSGATLPLHLLLSPDGLWAGAVSLAVQEIRGPEPPTWIWPVLSQPTTAPSPLVVGPLPSDFRSLETRSAPSLFFSGALARRLEGGWSLGVSLSRAELDAVDGVEHLFAGSRTLEQDATLTDYRAGVVRESEEGILEGVLVHRRFDGEYRAGYLEWVPPEDPASCEPGVPCGGWTTRTEVNPDRTRTTGVQVGWVQRMPGSSWRIGTRATLNYKDHPKIPDYEIMNIPRDPGTTWAWSAGVGAGHSGETGEFGVDLIIEPVRSETWAAAQEPVERDGGGMILPGERTVENDFDFNNVRLRIGGSERVGAVRGDLGLQVYVVSYDLVQDDRVATSTRHEEESWVEWTPTWGIAMNIGSVEISYRGRVTLGTGRPAIAPEPIPWARTTLNQSAGIDFLPAPRGPLALDAAHATTHRIGVSVPLD